MEYIESNQIELKRSLNEELKAEIIAFLNSESGGIIYVGVNDDGSLYETTMHERDENESKIIHWIRDEAIYPNCSEFVRITYNEDQVMVISIKSGDNKPYYLKSKGPKPSGVYIRYGRNKTQASPEEITRMILEHQNISYEELISKRQDLTFNTLRAKFNECGLNYEAFNMVTSGFIEALSGHYTNLAFWFSDQYNRDVKMAVYQGLDRSVFRSKKEFEGSIIKQIDQVIEYFDLCNEIRVIIKGSPMRTEIPSYNMEAAREGILNCFCHRDYYRKSSIKIEFFDNRCEIISPGGFYGGLTLEEALSGVQSFRNENLVKLLFKLGYIENYASGLTRIFNLYEQVGLKPKIESTLSALKLILPNRNYEAFSSLMIAESRHNTYNGALNGALNGVLNGSVLKLYYMIMQRPGVNRKELALLLNKSESTLDKQLKILLDQKYIKRQGSRKTGGYIVIKEYF